MKNVKWISAVLCMAMSAVLNGESIVPISISGDGSDTFEASIGLNYGSGIGSGSGFAHAICPYYNGYWGIPDDPHNWHFYYGSGWAKIETRGKSVYSSYFIDAGDEGGDVNAGGNTQAIGSVHIGVSEKYPAGTPLMLAINSSAYGPLEEMVFQIWRNEDPLGWLWKGGMPGDWDYLEVEVVAGESLSFQFNHDFFVDGYWYFTQEGWAEVEFTVIPEPATLSFMIAAALTLRCKRKRNLK